MDRLKAIETFVRIAQTGSLSKAAQELGTSRALASSHLKQLEDHLGARLVNRTTRQLSLTEIGQEYLTFCQATLASFEETESAISRRRDEPRGTLKILASMAFGNLHLAPAIARFTAEHSDIKVSLILTDTSFSPFELIDQGYDLAVWMHSIEDMSIISTKLGEELGADDAHVLDGMHPDREVVALINELERRKAGVGEDQRDLDVAVLSREPRDRGRQVQVAEGH